MPRYEVMKPKRSDYYLGEPIYYSHEWHPSVGGTGDVITSDSDTYIQKLKPKTIYVPRKKKSSYIKYTSPRYVRKEPVTVIRTSNATYPVVHEYKARSSKHVMKPVEVITTRPFAKHKSSTTFIEDTTSLDDHSVSQFSNMTIDDMSAINREVEAVLQQYEKVFDDTLTKEFEKRAATTKDTESVIYKTLKQATDAELLRRKKSPGVPETLTPEQIKLLSMDKPPLDKLKEIPVQYLKPRLPPYLKEKIILTSEAKKVEETVKPEINTDDLLKGLFQDMASKGLTGGISEYKTGKINKFVETKHLNSIGTQTTVQKSANSTCSNDRLSSEQSTEQSTVVQLNKSLHGSMDSLKKETSKSKFSMKFVNLNNLDQLVDEAIKFDTSIANSDSEHVKCCINEICPNFNGSGDNKSKDHNEFCLDSPTDTEKIIDDNIMKKELNQSKSAQLRECLSDLTHSGKQERLDYTNKSKQKTIYNCWQYNDIDTDKNISENNYSSSAPAAAENIAYSKSYLKDKAYRFNAEKSGNSTYSYRTQTSMLDGISQESLSLQKLSEGTPSTRTVFGLPSLQTTISTETAKTESNSTSEKNINGNPMNSSQPLAAGDSLRNHKKIVDLITECFSVNENDEMEGMNHRISHIDSTLCVEIMRKITDTLMKYQPNLLSTENVNKSVHLNILKQLRTDHLRHIQQEIKHIEDLDQFLHNFGLNNQSGDNDSKIYKLEVNLSDN